MEMDPHSGDVIGSFGSFKDTYGSFALSSELDITRDGYDGQPLCQLIVYTIANILN